jgi:hypothetical protein
MGILRSKAALEALVAQFEEADPERVRPDSHQVQFQKGWRPKLNPIQQKAHDNKAIYKLYYGERGSGKSHLGVEEIVDYCYKNDNCLGFIILKEFAMGTEGGAWNKLLQDVIPEWQQGIGIQATETRYDPQTKKPYIWLSNRHGGWSMIMLASLPVAHQVEGKVRGREPDIILVDEAQTLETDTYFTSLLMQLGRKKKKSGDPSKIIFCCNPEGPSHWLYKRFFEMPVNEETGAWDARYAHFHIPVSDNLPNLSEGYYENYVLPAVKNDPVMKARLVDGEWVDRVEGDSLFEGAYSDLFIRGDAAKGLGLLPVVPNPMIVSYDLGGAHSSIHFLQIVPTLDKVYRLCLDELDYVGQYTPYAKSIPQVIERMRYWEDKMKFEFVWTHISDSSAFNMYRAEGGSYDVWDVEKISRAYVEKHGLPERFIVRMKECPKGEFSIEARVRLVTDSLVSGSTLISATCRRTREMFMRLPHDPKDRLKPKPKSRYVHNFDSYSYGYFYYSTRRTEVPGAVEAIKPQYYSA